MEVLKAFILSWS